MSDCLRRKEKNGILHLLAQKAFDLEGIIEDTRENIKFMKGYNVEPDKEVLKGLEEDNAVLMRLIESVQALDTCD